MPESSSLEQLATALRTAVTRLGPGERLPSTRALVDTHRVSPVTVSRAIGALAAEGLVVTRPGAGTFRAEPVAPAAPVDYGWQTAVLTDREIDTRGLSSAEPIADDTVISLSTGYLHSSLMPLRALGAAAGRAARRPGVWERPTPTGVLGLRTWLARSAGAGVDARDVTVTTGGQSAMATVVRAIVAPGETLLVESPSYPGAIAAARAAGIRTVPVPTDGDGVIPEQLADAFGRTRARAVFLQPTYANPAGAVLAPQRRREVLAAARAAGAFIIEDDWARWLGHDDRTPPPLLHDDDDGRVVYLCSLTKKTSQDLRIGAMIARGPVIERLRALRMVDELYVSRIMQETALELVTHPGWDRHLSSLRQSLARRAAATVAGVRTHLPAATLVARPRGGLHAWLRLPEGLDDLSIVQDARRGGVTVMPGRPFFSAEPSAPHLRLTYAAAADEADLDTGLRRLAAAVPALSRAA